MPVLPASCAYPRTVQLSADEHLTLLHNDSDRLLSSSALRLALTGRWIYHFGDSSTRGIFLSLWQQLVPGVAWFERSNVIMTTGLRYIGYMDLIINASNGAVLHLHDVKRYGRAGVATAPDDSANLALPWRRHAKSCVRLTLRFVTMARFIAADQFRELQPHGNVQAATPDGYVLQVGSWDEKTPAPTYEAQLMDGLTRLQQLASHSHQSITQYPTTIFLACMHGTLQHTQCSSTHNT